MSYRTFAPLFLLELSQLIFLLVVDQAGRPATGSGVWIDAERQAC